MSEENATQEYTRRISVEEGVAAFQASGRTPRQGFWVSDETVYSSGRTKEVSIACGLGAVYAAGMLGVTDPQVDGLAAERAAILALGGDYVDGFTSGFDQVPLPITKKNPRFRDGYEDGAAVWEAVKNGVPKLVPDVVPQPELAHV